MLTITNGFGKKLLSAFIACTLAVTMTPLPSAAFAAEPAQEASAQAESAEASSAADDAAGAEAAGESADSAAGAQAQGDRVYESVELTQDAAADDGASVADADAAPAASAQNGAAAIDPADIEMTSAELSLAGDAAQTAIAYAGLSYVVNEDGETVTLTGWTGKAPAGDVRVPGQIASGGKTYAVTNICPMGGGVFAHCRF